MARTARHPARYQPGNQTALNGLTLMARRIPSAPGTDPGGMIRLTVVLRYFEHGRSLERLICKAYTKLGVQAQGAILPFRGRAL